MARNRRNKRSVQKLTDFISLKTFLILFLILTLIIISCVGIIYYRNYEDRQLLAKQKEELDRQIESIFSETLQNIADNHTRKPDSVIRISAVGDILCGEEMLKDAYEESTKSYEFDQMFKNITGFIEGSDLVLGTMESNFTNKPYSGYGNRNSPKSFATAVKNSGVNLVSISTNHSLDYGKEGLKTTKTCLEEIGFSTVGDRLDDEPVNIQTIKDTKIAFLSYTYGVEDESKKSQKDLESLNIYSEKIAKQELEYAKENADYIFVIMHWGAPYATEPNKEQKKISDFLIKNGADVILGNHPAAIQPMEIKQNSEGENVFIAYSLGNYISSINNDVSKIELVLNIELRKSGEDGKVVLSKVDYTPIYALDHGEKAKNRYELIDMKGVAKSYASGNKEIVDKGTYEKLLDGLDLLQKVIVPKKQEETVQKQDEETPKQEETPKEEVVPKQDEVAELNQEEEKNKEKEGE